MELRASIQPLAISALQQSPISALHNLEVSQEGEAIVITGKVGSYYYKQLAQEAVISVAGDREIRNHVRVLKAGAEV